MVRDSTFDAVVHDVRYKFGPVGEVIPIIVLHRPGHNIPYYCEINGHTKSTPIARGDHVRISISSASKMNEIAIIQSGVTDITYPMFMLGNQECCPYCGNRLIYTNSQGYGECHVKICPAQISSNIQTFVNGIGLYFYDMNSLIFHNLLTRGVFNDYIDIFTVNAQMIQDLDNLVITPHHITNFLTYVESFKGNINLFQVLNGINIPYITPRDIDEILKAYVFSTFTRDMFSNNFTHLSHNTRSILTNFFNMPDNKNSIYKLTPVVTDGVFVEAM